MDKQRKKELRKLLTGQTIRNEEGWLVAIPDGSRLIYHGASDNTGRRLTSHSATLALPQDMDTDTLVHTIVKCLQQMGLMVNMQTWPEALCVLKRYYLTKAVLLCVAPGDNGGLELVAYTGRSLTSAICCRRAIGQFKKLLFPQEQ